MAVFFLFSLSHPFLIFLREAHHLHAFGSAATLVFSRAVRALDKQQMAVVIGAVYMKITGAPALVAGTDHLSCNSFSHSCVKNKIFSDEPGSEILFMYLAGILNYSAI